MDEIDNAILQQLLINSRLTNREIAEVVNLSVSSVHKRIKALEDDKIITAYIARPSIQALNSIPIVIIGRTKIKSMESIQQQLGEHENVFTIAIASGKVLYISGILRNIAELQNLSSFVTSVAQLEDPIIGIVNEPFQSMPKQLSPFELKILKSLNRDARKSLIDVADEIGSTVKTVKKHIDLMIEEEKATFTIEWAPLYKESFISVFHLETQSGEEISTKINQLISKFQKNLVVCAGFANLPNFILLETWTQSPRESQEIEDELYAEGFKDVIPHVLLSITWYNNWMDDMLQKSD